jgi:hypothetical protein
MLIDVSREEFERFKTEAQTKQWGWPAALSTNEWRDAWHPTGRGYTAMDERELLHKRFPFVDQIIEAYLELRPPGGRFFIDDEIAYTKSEHGGELRFALAYYKPEQNGSPRYAIAVLRIGS